MKNILKNLLIPFLLSFFLPLTVLAVIGSGAIGGAGNFWQYNSDNVSPNNTTDDVGVGTTTPFGAFAVEQDGSTDPLVWIGDTGTSTPFLAVRGNGRVGIASSTPGAQLGVGGDIIVGGNFTVTGTCTGCTSLSGGSADTLTYWTSATAISATSSPTVGWVAATSTTASSSLQDLLFADAQGTSLSLSGAVSITCTSCITDTNVSNTLTASDLVAGSSVVSDAEVDGNLTISAGTVNNTPIGATTASTGRFTTLYAESTLQAVGATNLYGNLTATSTIDFVDAATFKVPTSASSTITASGELEIDTTDSAIHFNVSGTTRSLPAIRIFGVSVASTTASENIPLPVTHDNAFRISEVKVKLATLESYGTATTVGATFNLAHGTNLGNRTNLFTVAQGSSRVDSGTSTFTVINTGFNDATVALDEEWWLTTSAASSSLHTLVVQIFGYFDP